MDQQIENNFLTHCIGKKAMAPSTAKTYIQQVKMFEKRVKIPLDQVTRENVVQYLTDLKLKLNKNANTRRLAKIGLETFYTWFAPISKMELPTKDLQKIKKYVSNPRLIHPDELERMLYELTRLSTDWGRQACAILAFLSETGIRLEEFENLKAGDVRVVKDDQNTPTHLEVTVNSNKTSCARVIPFANLLEGSLSEYFVKYFFWLIIERGQKPSGPLFFRLENKHAKIPEDMSYFLKRWSVRYAIKKASFLAGIDRKISPHQFRHFYATYSTINGMNLFSLKELMGHASIATTQRYVHIAEITRGNILKHSATAGLRASKESTGYAALMREYGRKMNFS